MKRSRIFTYSISLTVDFYSNIDFTRAKKTRAVQMSWKTSSSSSEKPNIEEIYWNIEGEFKAKLGEMLFL